MKKLLMLLLLAFFSSSANITVYYGAGCPHCASTMQVLSKLGANYTPKEVYQNSVNRDELFLTYAKFSTPMELRGVPTTVINDVCVIVGDIGKEKWRRLIELCDTDKCPEGVFTYYTIDELLKEATPTVLPEPTPTISPQTEEKITWGVLVSAALVDSINPCTIAVMAMLLATILLQKGRKKVVAAGLVFVVVIFISYMLMGLGILQTITASGLIDIFYLAVTVLAALITIVEFKAYLDYKPGFFSVEMPMWLRPYTKRVIENVTSLPTIAIAALFCSLFLLPCSSGPYLVVLSLLAKAKTANNLFYLVIYNLFFILPLVIVTAIVGIGLATPEQVSEIKDKHVRKTHLISGILMLIVLLFLLAQQFGMIL
jgi:glutaredoxin